MLLSLKEEEVEAVGVHGDGEVSEEEEEDGRLVLCTAFQCSKIGHHSDSPVNSTRMSSVFRRHSGGVRSPPLVYVRPSLQLKSLTCLNLTLQSYLK